MTNKELIDRLKQSPEDATIHFHLPFKATDGTEQFGCYLHIDEDNIDNEGDPTFDLSSTFGVIDYHHLYITIKKDK